MNAAAGEPAMIRLEGVWRTYRMGEATVHALREVDLGIDAGEYLALIGPSGSGKSTLLNVLGFLDRPTAGTYRLDGRDVGQLGEDERSRLRQHEIGFVFQFFHLLPRLDALGNVELPMLFAGLPRAERRQRATSALERVGLADRARHRPEELSGGQRQRVAIARATVMRPRLVLADEPTGNLDRSSAQEVMAVLEELNQQGQTLVLVTHDPELAARAGRTIRMDDGSIVEG